MEYKEAYILLEDGSFLYLEDFVILSSEKISKDTSDKVLNCSAKSFKKYKEGSKN